MKSTIPLSAIVLVTVLALAGCNQNTPSNPSSTQTTNASTSGNTTNIPLNSTTNMSAAN
jgi:hypothetical protein